MPSGALFAVAVAVWMAPVKVEAGCAHPLITRSDGDAIGRMIETLSVGRSTPDRATIPMGPVESPRPCTGPSCSGNPVAPSGPPLAVSLTRFVDPWACLDAPYPPAEHRSYPLVPGRCDPRPDGQSLAIFHPPRLHFAMPRMAA